MQYINLMNYQNTSHASGQPQIVEISDSELLSPSRHRVNTDNSRVTKVN